MTPLLSIVAVSIESPEWAELLVKSVRKFTANPYEIIIVDNGSLDKNLGWLRSQSDIRLLEQGYNRGHGKGIDIGVAAASGAYVCVMDIDAHFQRHEWDTDLIDLYHDDDRTRLIGCVGPEHKPLHPPLFFFERDFVQQHKIFFRYDPSGGPKQTDSCQQAYWDIIALGYKVLRLEKGRKVYVSKMGDEIWIAGKPTICHHWYGTRFQENNPERTKSVLDGHTLEEHLEHKRLMFAEPLVKEILADD